MNCSNRPGLRQAGPLERCSAGLLRPSCRARPCSVFASFPLFVVLVLAAVEPASADIYQWQWQNPADPSAGVVQSATLCPDGSGATAAPGANLSSRNLSNAYLVNANCTGANLNNAVLSFAALSGADLSGGSVANTNFGYTTPLGFSASQLYATANYAAGNLSGIGLSGNNLGGWSFANQNLTHANLSGSTLASTSFSGAIVAEADLSYTTSAGFTASQLYNTASYQTGNLSGLWLNGNILANWTFAGKNLSTASFEGATLAGANFSAATITGANFSSTTPGGLTAAQIYATASYIGGNLAGIGLKGNDLSNWGFSGQNLANARFDLSTLAGADFTAATITGASFIGAVDFTPQQLYATASYQAKELSGIQFFGNNLSGWNFAAQDLAGAFFDFANLANANLMHANLNGAAFSGANLNAADLRVAAGFTPGDATLVDAIQPSGTIANLQLSGSGQPLLVVRNDSSGSPVAVRVTQGMTIGSGGTLQVLLGGNPWNSTISFDPSIPVTLGGRLLLGADVGVNPVALVGRSYQVFDWTGVAPSGAFQIASGLPANFAWNTSGLYSAGMVSLAGTLVWNGGGPDANWTTAANWSGFTLGPYVTLAFDGSNHLNPANNFTANSQFSGIVFQSTAGTFTLAGNPLQLLGDVVNNSPNPQTINLDAQLLGDTKVVTNGDVLIGGNISGNFRLIKSGAGTLTLSGTNGDLTETVIAGGTLIATTPTALPDGENLVVGDGEAFASPSIVGEASSAMTGGRVAAVPEPGTLVLLLVAFASLRLCVSHARRRNRRSG